MDSKKRALIKKNSNHIKPTIIIGSDGIHENIFKSIQDGFNTNEVLKVKVNRIDNKDKKIVREFADQIAIKNSCEVIAVIGTTIILYKEHKDKEKRMF